MDGAVAVLAEVDLVEVGLEDLLLAVVELEQHRHHELGELARQRALRREEEVLHELLRDGAAALHALRAEREHRARERARVEAVVRVVVVVLGGDQLLHQQRRHVAQSHEHPVLVSRRINAADRHGLEARQRELASFGVGKGGDRAAVEAHAHTARRLRAVGEQERPHRDVERVVRTHVPARRLARPVGVAKPRELVLDVEARDVQADVQLERPGVDARGQREAPPLELGAHAHVEVERKRAHAEERDEERVAEKPEDATALSHQKNGVRSRIRSA